MKTFGDIFEDFSQVPSSQNFFETELNQHTISKRKKWAWTDTNPTRRFDIERIVMDRETYWPLTERGIFYQIYQMCLHKSHWHKNGKISNGPMKVTAVIGAITELLKWLRIGEVIPWEAIVDEQRLLTNKVGFGDTEGFIRQEMEYFLDVYKRCLAKRQPHYVEVWVEKQILRHIIQPITDKYCLRLMCCKGYNSVTFQNHFYDRAMEAINLNKSPVVLYFGDWDPSG